MPFCEGAHTEAGVTMRVLSPRLPLHTRAGLAVRRRVDIIGCWLVELGHTGSAERLWRLCRMWR